MPAAAQPWRLALFCAACVVLLVAAIGFARGESHPAPAPSATPSVPLPATGGAAALRVALGGQARRFLTAFFRYEVGDVGPGVRRTLRADATPGFAAELLSSPPRRPARSVPAAVPGRLAIAVASVVPPRAVVSGSASRDSEAEQFSFIFTVADGTWLASGPAE